MKSIASFFAKTPEPNAPLRKPGSDGPDAEYQALASKLGVYLNAPQRTLEDALSELGIGAYKHKAVDRYLIKHRPVGKVYCWKPLRSIDCQRLQEYWRQLDSPRISTDRENRISYRTSDPQDDGDIVVFQRYLLPVPYPVLLTVDKIVSKVPDAIFLVSDYETPQPPDPFLAVIGRSNIMHIIERWDEPSFRG